MLTIETAPLAPRGRSGWPWTEATEQRHAVRSRTAWPRVTVVTPSFNQAQFLEETIRSVLLQGYPNLEYVVLDGGSSDGSIEIIKRYSPWLARWESGPDGGQAAAINSGWEGATGSIVAYLNSDDAYAPGTVFRVVEAFEQSPEAEIVYSDCEIMDENSRSIDWMRARPFSVRDHLRHNLIPQPTLFVRRSVIEKEGLLRAELRYTMDFEFCLRAGSRHCTKVLAGSLAKYRTHSLTKSASQAMGFFAEWRLILEAARRDEDLRRWIPESPRARESIALFNLGVLHYAHGRSRDAFRAFLASARHDPSMIIDAEWYVCLAKTLVNPGAARKLRRFIGSLRQRP
jgi:glycosyltransferase involved in cell wall biosynthesis